MFSVNFSITGKRKENYLISILIYPRTKKSCTFLWPCEWYREQECNKNLRMQTSEDATLNKRGCHWGGQDWESPTHFPKAHQHVTSTGFYEKHLRFTIIPVFLLSHPLKYETQYSCLYFLKDFIYLERGREGERKAEKHQCVCLLLRTWLRTQVCALTGNLTGNPLVYRPALNPLESHQPGLFLSF